MTKNSVSLTLYLRNRTWYNCGFWYTCKMMVSPAFCFIFSKFGFFRLLEAWKGKKWPKITNLSLSHSVSVDHIIKIFGTQLENNDISRCFSLLFWKKCNMVNIKILTFFIGPLQQFFNKQLFFHVYQ